MESMDIVLNYFSKSSFITIFVLSWLSLYFIMSFTILFSRMTGLGALQRKEQNALESLLMGAKNLPRDSFFKKFISNGITKEKLHIALNLAERRSTSGLVWLGIIASTSPFIGLFGTVVSILETFSNLGSSANTSLNVIAPAISEALIATGAGIFVAIPAYTFNLLIKRKAYELIGVLQRQADVIFGIKDEIG
ncbi:MotA/TolQ/ExbB proton channel family protein [Campylobacter pinnipediorum]|uniref:Flagellar motor protein MotA n=1 Tax=Campylobacter pinnipediorum subsp. pinnipediorum TaxID=1660067 RepID=A0AAX0LB57_9BACT|nr:MotA/TolQ/ExbB proton channel family protein [Campylobacter pinnipediorum]AQW81603.1 Tol-Pal system subunit TolQ [Campylobacter pinnipediorum subsp. pinnipediorum]AQW83231.1 Tol-Pal system subunit TolQ [Campylobacter pinnipediorum subsp. pinnipediorum]OPA79661.1 flagellar motor protein MotA [Campylobacter pinnipediorum subsp. pinnipediorum]OPA81735.1 flagellar motor protein MotA [Campylobacter pinnipediorum subsp. pinnipediorum]